VYHVVVVLTKISVRALGETDLNPVSGLGKISQLVFAVVQPSNVVASLIAGGAPLVFHPIFWSVNVFLKGWQKPAHSSKLANQYLGHPLTVWVSSGPVI
jgi:hypothetical protein